MLDHIISCIFLDEEPRNFIEGLLCFFFPFWFIPFGVLLSIIRIFKNIFI